MRGKAEPVAAALDRPGLPFDGDSRAVGEGWGGSHQPDAHGTHAYDPSDF